MTSSITSDIKHVPTSNMWTRYCMRCWYLMILYNHKSMGSETVDSYRNRPSQR